MLLEVNVTQDHIDNAAHNRPGDCLLARAIREALGWSSAQGRVGVYVTTVGEGEDEVSTHSGAELVTSGWLRWSVELPEEAVRAADTWENRVTVNLEDGTYMPRSPGVEPDYLVHPGYELAPFSFELDIPDGLLK